MINFILSLIGVFTLCFFSFVLGAVAFALGAYEKIKEKVDEKTAKSFIDFLKD